MLKEYRTVGSISGPLLLVESVTEAKYGHIVEIELPDEGLANVIRASQVHCMLAARNEAGGTRKMFKFSGPRFQAGK